jgi:hypothetical protein
MPWGDTHLTTESVTRKEKVVRQTKSIIEEAGLTLEPKEILAKKPDQKLTWAQKAIELARTRGAIKITLLYDIFSNPKFVLQFGAGRGAKLRALVDDNVDLFTEKQRKFLQSDACKLTTFEAGGGSDEEDKDKVANAGEGRTTFKATLFNPSAQPKALPSLKRKAAPAEEDKPAVSIAEEASLNLTNGALKQEVASQKSKDKEPLDEASESKEVKKKDKAGSSDLFQPQGNLARLLEMGKQSVSQAKADLVKIASALPTKAETPPSSRDQRSRSRSRSRGGRGSARRGRGRCQSESRSRSDSRGAKRKSTRGRSDSRDRNRGSQRSSRPPPSRTARYVWTEVGIDYIKDNRRFEKHGSPSVGTQLKSVPPEDLLIWMLDEGHCREETLRESKADSSVLS